MSEQKQGYMAELDHWTEETILSPFAGALIDTHRATDDSATAESEKHLDEVEAQVKQAVREKVLQSYRNGQATGPAKRSYGKPRQR